ncbi:hypothetical protein TVAG_009630 [Trichomonas vaginalis G3]|uniref:Uncharacterized protein n=1 Tax=Trichomonas vaginalis (strain ATCC PRA-98 / G3) TaxID=412133 RepID=A2ET40_TRIV3|nr:hypothetical protein TVAGG3_0468210 [Trichomonas vaginalis G3]EAY04156.1 hypothetical protein TVAG_009630 [Trichomonas vaginalis G3]KAI5514882.1 hypothetical protein TVAGG3_0468210 [Trichomonas vaginalis G3]|eukprot:XP_001316379.1 hypothetical protein [Trichomonas vaginalis G3]
MAKYLPNKLDLINDYAQILIKRSIPEEKVLKSIILADNLDVIIKIRSAYLPPNVDKFFEFSYINNAPKCFEWMFTKIKQNFDGLRPNLLKKDPVNALEKAVFQITATQ